MPHALKSLIFPRWWLAPLLFLLAFLVQGTSASADPRPPGIVCADAPTDQSCSGSATFIIDGAPVQVYFANYPRDDIELWQSPVSTIDAFLVLFYKDNYSGNPFDYFSLRVTTDTGYLVSDAENYTGTLFYNYTFTCDNGGKISFSTSRLVTPPTLRPTPTPTPTPTGDPCCDQTPPPTQTPCVGCGPTPTPTPARTPPPRLALAGAPAPNGDIVMRPDPYTRVRPDRTEFEVVNIRPDVKSLVNVATPGVPESGDSGRDNFTVIGSRSIREEFVPIQSTATWDFGDRIGSDSGYYRTSYLFPHTSRDGTTTLDNLPAYDVKATIGWELYVTLSYQYTYTVRVQVGTECVRYERVPNSPPELPIPGFSIGDCLQERPVYEDQLRGPFNYNSGQVRIFNPNLSAYGLTGDANSRVTYELHKKVVVVQTDILDGSGAQPNGANGTYPNTPLQLYTPRP